MTCIQPADATLLCSDAISTQESGTGALGMSLQRTGPTTWNAVAQNTFGATYQNYIPANLNAVPTCRLASDGSISYAAGGGSGCSASQTGAYTSPVTQPPLNAQGPRIIGAGQLPDAATTTALRSASGKGSISSRFELP